MLLTTDFFHPTIGGAERQVQLLASALAARGHTVTVATVRQRGIAQQFVNHPWASSFKIIISPLVTWLWFGAIIAALLLALLFEPSQRAALAGIVAGVAEGEEFLLGTEAVYP